MPAALLFAYHLVQKHPLTNETLSSFFIPKVLISAAKILKSGSQIKITLTMACSIVKMVAREVTIFPDFFFF